ncbi:uncharacterized protein LOC129590365 [Paramacrobiotus metropolitanus]|uniref:uncharacterized protein LOC129590365 n=1 Tax=Paramacrobiotus metropolitanus TaxID=2943436 RepID=UPI002445F243|nr:uncharacterized protein LOC129590365 [Paramacrobiotus metropolitanus]
MDSVKNWYRSKSMNFSLPGNPMDFKSHSHSGSYGATDRALKHAADVCKKLQPSAETRSAVLSTVRDVTDYGRKLVIPNEATKQKVSRFYESRVAKLKYAQLDDGFRPGHGQPDDLTRICVEVDSDDSHPYYQPRPHADTALARLEDQQVPSIEPLSLPARLRTHSLGAGAQPTSAVASRDENPFGTSDWNGSFMQYKDPVRRPF